MENRMLLDRGRFPETPIRVQELSLLGDQFDRSPNMSGERRLAIEDLINLVAERKMNRIPIYPIGLRKLRILLARIQKGPWLFGIPKRAIETFFSAGQKVLEDMEQHLITYEEIRLWTGTAWPIIRQLPEDGLKEKILTILTSCHDYYVLMKNSMRPKGDPIECGEGKNLCNRCGQCCIGPAEGPLSWRKEEILRWERDGRDDIFYFTAPVGPIDVPRASSLRFLICPFLRFNPSGLGLCLIHPVKPKECLEFVCNTHS